MMFYSLFRWIYNSPLNFTCKHPEFDEGSGAFPNDLALLELHLDGRDTSRNAVTVADGSNPFVGELCRISGWGVTGNLMYLILWKMSFYFAAGLISRYKRATQHAKYYRHKTRQTRVPLLRGNQLGTNQPTS